jgi:hypothetical protein
MSDAIITALISAVSSLVVAFGTWHLSIKKDREKQTEEIKGVLSDHREEYLSGIRSVQDDISKVNATVQNQISIVELEIKTLSDRVDKHNNVIERTYRLEQESAVQAEQIRNLQGKVG